MSAKTGSQDFLTEMARTSASRVRSSLQRTALSELRARSLRHPPPRLQLSPSGFDLVAEVKFTSPSGGRLVCEAPSAAQTARRVCAYASAGARAISVLTEPERFSGSLRHLQSAARSSPVPVLRKDFLVDPYQVWEARAYGAAGVLLIVRMLDDAALEAMLGAAREARQFCLLEAFDREDLLRITQHLDQGRRTRRQSAHAPMLVGVNGRDLVTLEVDTERHLSLAPYLPAGVPAVAESGLATPGDVARCARAGYRLGLVGMALMRAGNPAQLIRAMLSSAREASAGGPCA